MTGGLFTAVAYAALLLLLVAELGSFLRTSYQTDVWMDSNRQLEVTLNFDIHLYDLPCKFLKLGVWDKFGAEQLNTTDRFHYIPMDHLGQFKGMAYTKEEISALEQSDLTADISPDEKAELDADWSSSSDHFKHNNFQRAVTFHDFTLVNFYAEWCSHCREFHPTWKAAADKLEAMNFLTDDGKQAQVKFMKMNCVDFQKTCQDVRIAAFPSLRLYKHDGTFEAFQDKRSAENIEKFITETVKNSHLIVSRHHSMFSEGCKVQGSLKVPRTPGAFHLQAEAFDKINLNPALTNVSHFVNHLSFGDKLSTSWATRNNIPQAMLGNIAPLDGKTFVVEKFHEAPQHYLKVVSTHVEGKNYVFYQMTHTDRIRKLRKLIENGKSMENAVPQARFSYDFSPMAVVLKVKQKAWYEFLTSLFAILGGTYTIMELCSGAVETVSTAVKESMGKNN